MNKKINPVNPVYPVKDSLAEFYEITKGVSS